MKIAQIALLISLFFVGRFLISKDNKLVSRILILLILLLGIISILQPDLTSSVAQKIGIGRGADLIFYLYILGSLLIFAYLRNTINALQRNLTSLTREIALFSATKQGLPVEESEAQITSLKNI
jgi:hypothetical protein